jgi:CMP-N-acetylneuraminic acid synthetase
MIYKVIIPARANSKRLPGKNMRILGDKPLVEHSIDYALNHFPKDSIWMNSDSEEIIKFSKLKGIRTLLRPDKLAEDLSSTLDVLKHHINYFEKHNINCDALILLQPTNPFRDSDLLNEAIKYFEASGRKSLATFSLLEKKLGNIENGFFRPSNYIPGQRSQDLKENYFENGLLYITKCKSILAGKVITDDVYPFVCNTLESSIDIDYLEDFKFAETLLKMKK